MKKSDTITVKLDMGDFVQSLQKEADAILAEMQPKTPVNFQWVTTAALELVQSRAGLTMVEAVEDAIQAYRILAQASVSPDASLPGKSL